MATKVSCDSTDCEHNSHGLCTCTSIELDDEGVCQNLEEPEEDE